MGKKIGLGVGAVVLILVIWFGITASGVANEASKADSILKDAQAQHKTQADVSQQLKSLGFEMTDGQGVSDGKGQVHSMVVYTTRLTVHLTFDQDNKTASYHLDRI